MSIRLGVLASGRGSNFLAILRSIENGELDAELCLLISDREHAPVLEIARQRGIPAWHVSYSRKDRQAFELEVAALLDYHACDLVILAGFMRLVTPWLIQRFPRRILNIHPSLLPAFKGLKAQAQALAYGVKISGCTVHIVNDELDGGPIIAQKAVEVRSDDTVESLSARILVEEHRLYPEAIRQYSETYSKAQMMA